MLNLVCGDAVGIGKTGVMTALAIADATDREKNKLRAEAVKDLRADGFNISRDYYALYSNYPIHREFYERNLESITLTNDEISRLSRIGDPDGIFIRPFSTLAIMEAQTVFSARNWQQFTPKQSEFFQTSRHYGIDIFLDTQDADNIEKTLRYLCRVIYVHKRTIYDAKGKKVATADKYNLSRIEWDITSFERFKWYEKGVNGVDGKVSIDYNIFDCYNPFENYKNYLPLDKKTLIK